MEWEEQRGNDVPRLAYDRHIASMAGDSETHLRGHAENENIIRQPFLIGVSGGTASGKVGTSVILTLYSICLLGLVTDEMYGTRS